MSDEAERLFNVIREIVRQTVREELRALEPPPAPRDERTYSEEEFCQRVGMSRSNARKLRREGKLWFIRVHAREVRYSIEHEREFLKARESKRVQSRSGKAGSRSER